MTPVASCEDYQCRNMTMRAGVTGGWPLQCEDLFVGGDGWMEGDAAGWAAV